MLVLSAVGAWYSSLLCYLAGIVRNVPEACVVTVGVTIR